MQNYNTISFSDLLLASIIQKLTFYYINRFQKSEQYLKILNGLE